MDKRIFILLSFFWLGCESSPELIMHQGYALGTSYSAQYQGIDADYETVQAGIDSIFYEVNKSLSTYLPESDISQINRGDSTLVVDHHFKAVFNKANLLWYKTQGLFDPTVGTWVNVYGFGPEKPLAKITPAQRDSIMEVTGWARIQLKEGRIVKDDPGIYIDFNAIAKGYTVDLVAQFLTRLGSKNHLVEIGGEVVAKGISPTSRTFWKIGIDNPQQTEERSLQAVLSLENQALATSGNYRKFRVDVNTGQKYVHSINPLNGKPVRSNVLSASVKAPDCMTADAYATSLMVMPFEQGKALIEADPSLSAYWILANGSGIEEVTSSRW